MTSTTKKTSKISKTEPQKTEEKIAKKMKTIKIPPNHSLWVTINAVDIANTKFAPFDGIITSRMFCVRRKYRRAIRRPRKRTHATMQAEEKVEQKIEIPVYVPPRKKRRIQKPQVIPFAQWKTVDIYTTKLLRQGLRMSEFKWEAKCKYCGYKGSDLTKDHIVELSVFQWVLEEKKPTIEIIEALKSIINDGKVNGQWLCEKHNKAKANFIQFCMGKGVKLPAWAMQKTLIKTIIRKMKIIVKSKNKSFPQRVQSQLNDIIDEVYDWYFVRPGTYGSYCDRHLKCDA